MGRINEQLFIALPEEQAPAHLCEQVYQTLFEARIRSERIRLIVSSLVGMSSLLGLVLSLPLLFRAAQTTGFSSYAPLAVSDSDLVVAHFGTFIASLLEAVPGPEITLTLFLLAVFLVSFRNFVRSFAYKPFRHAIV